MGQGLGRGSAQASQSDSCVEVELNSQLEGRRADQGLTNPQFLSGLSYLGSPGSGARIIAGILMLFFIGGCGWENFGTDDLSKEEIEALESAEFDFVRIRTRTGPILLPEEGLIGPYLVRITTPGERQILLRSARILSESIQGEEIYDIYGDSINLSEVVVPFDSVSMIEARVNYFRRHEVWITFGSVAFIIFMVTYNRR